MRDFFSIRRAICLDLMGDIAFVGGLYAFPYGLFSEHKTLTDVSNTSIQQMQETPAVAFV